jgi:hypothetical protein
MFTIAYIRKPQKAQRDRLSGPRASCLRELLQSTFLKCRGISDSEFLTLFIGVFVRRILSSIHRIVHSQFKKARVLHDFLIKMMPAMINTAPIIFSPLIEEVAEPKRPKWSITREQNICPLTTNANVSATPCCWLTHVMKPTNMAPNKPPNQIYQGATPAGRKLTTAFAFTTIFSNSKHIKPTEKLSKEPIKGPPVCLPSLVFRIAWTGSNAPVKSVRSSNKYFI